MKFVSDLEDTGSCIYTTKQCLGAVTEAIAPQMAKSMIDCGNTTLQTGTAW